ncbi:MAG: 30S ribosome-binding factor RbfA [Candidatus Omnitrophica bacterium]|nr:30S ribosome-binding factor RbfA [Candidatus Omnitrophota bacterium]
MSQRSEQVAEELRKIISMILLRDLHDPRKGFVTITRVEIGADLRNAKVFYSILGSEAQKADTREMMNENRGFIKGLANQRLNMKFAVDIYFEEDASLEHSFKIESILKKIKKESGEK